MEPKDTISSGRRDLLLSLLPKDLSEKLGDHLNETNGNLEAASGQLGDDGAAQRVNLLNDLAELADDNEPIVFRLATDGKIKSLRNVASEYNVSDLAALAYTTPPSIASLHPQSLSRSVIPSTPSSEKLHKDAESANRTAQVFRRRIFLKEPTAVLSKMVKDAEIPISDDHSGEIRDGMVKFFERQPETFNIRTTPLTDAIDETPSSLHDLHPDIRKQVVSNLKSLQRVQALATTPAAVPVLLNKGFRSANAVSSVPAANFIQDVGADLGIADALDGDAAARAIHAHATNNALRSNMALTSTLQTVRGTGVRAIDGLGTREERITAAKTLAVSGKRSTVNLEQIFGSMDFCDCSDCSSINSPAAYFVEILQFLRNNNLKETYKPGWEGTALEKLFRRRPDLADIELTCANTNTVLPYIDLSNEVMESFVVHLKEYAQDTHDPKQSILEVFNVDNADDSSALLAQAANVNYKAYCIIKDAVYPFTLPYQQGLDEIRILLSHLGTSKYELMMTFRPPSTGSPEISKLEDESRDRSCTAEFFLLSQEEYKIITHEAFYSKNYFEQTMHQTISDDLYRQKIRILPVYKYWGYLNGDYECLSLSETDQIGLTFVKKQFLPRSGIAYTDLVDLLRTKYVNPNYPTGWALLLLERLRWSYRFLMTLVDQDKPTNNKYDRLITFLCKYQPLAELFEALREKYIKDMAMADQNKSEDEILNDSKGKYSICCCSCCDTTIWRCWVKRYFDLFGQLIVLDSRDGAVFEVEGWLVLRVEQESGPSVIRSPVPTITAASLAQSDTVDTDIGYLQRDGKIITTAINGEVTVVGHIDSTGVAIYEATGETFVQHYGLGGNNRIVLMSTDKTDNFADISTFDSRVEIYHLERAAQWGPVQDSCNLEKVRLVKLNGEPVSLEDFDRVQRFIRLWRKLGWSIDDLDQSLSGLSGIPTVDESDGDDPDSSESTPNNDSVITWDDLDDHCGSTDSSGGGGDTETCPLHIGEDWKPVALKNISPGFLTQLVAVKKLLDITGLELSKLLCFWTDISIHGQPKSLYARLFLTRNLLGMDQVFRADANGNFLTSSPPEKLWAHLPVIMAAFQIRSTADMATLISVSGLPADPDLTLVTVSAIYRYVLLAKSLSVKISVLPNFIALLGAPFSFGAIGTLKLFTDWAKLDASGFTLAQLTYIIRGVEADPLHTIGPSIINILKTTNQLIDGLASITATYPDIVDETKITVDTTRSFISLLFNAEVAAQITAVLEGTSVYTTNAPTGLKLIIPPVLTKLKYVDTPADPTKPAAASVTMAGIMTSDEVSLAKSLVPGNAWASAIDRVMNQPTNWFNDTLFGIFPDVSDAIKVLLDGDLPATTPPSTATDPNPVPDPGTAPGKRAYFLKYFLPFLRSTLSDRLIVDTMTGVSGLNAELTELLLSNLLISGSGSALDALRTLEQAPAPTRTWNGYLVAPSSDSFTFISTADTQPGPIILDGSPVIFSYQQEDPSNVWLSDPVKLVVGHLYTLFVPDRLATQLEWKTARVPKSTIPTSSLLSASSTDITADVFVKLVKVGIIINGFSLNSTEIAYFTLHKASFGAFDLNAFTLKVWMRMNAYTQLRNNLQAPDAPLVDLFKWASLPGPVDQLISKIIASTRWDARVDSLKALLGPTGFSLSKPEFFQNEISLVKLKTALDVVDKIGVAVNLLFDWSKPVLKFWPSRAIADSIRKVVRSRYTITDWEQIVQPLNNKLREDMKNALIAYLLVQPTLIEQGVTDADSLFEFFLIDVQMSSCLQTSRIKQAISTVQLFIQRCLLGLELDPDNGGQPVRVDAIRWSWMQKYRVWEANRKVFLYPENWLISTLRDDKSPFYVELESELLQKDVDAKTVTTAVKNYLFKVLSFHHFSNAC